MRIFLTAGKDSSRPADPAGWGKVRLSVSNDAIGREIRTEGDHIQSGGIIGRGYTWSPPPPPPLLGVSDISCTNTNNKPLCSAPLVSVPAIRDAEANGVLEDRNGLHLLK
ncbi:hypothetical protein J6590_058110 [Homalodisca vitripennis]|nr:hypothetical protein J6590_058110 [Homalodisca vitripennis]